MKKNKVKAQTWSFDMLAAIAMFMVIFILFFSMLLYTGTKDTTQELSTDAELLTTAVEETQGFKFIENGKVNLEKLEEIRTKDYTQLKFDLGIDADFCIYFVDEEGNLVNINNDLGDPNPQYTIGGGEITVGGTPCGE